MNHELYIGGPPTRNYSRSMFPAPPFNAADGAFKAVKVAAHKSPTGFALTRVMDTVDHAVAEYLRNNTVAQGDNVGAVLMPQNVVVTGIYYEVVTPAGVALVVTPSLRGIAGATLPTINCNVASKGFAKFGASAWQTTSGSLADAADGNAWFLADPAVLDLTLTTFTNMGKLKLVISPLVETVYHGGP